MQENIFSVATSEECVNIRSGGKRFSAGNRRGQAVTEFALILPLFMMIVMGQVAFGMAFHNYLVLTNAVNVGAQLLAVSRADHQPVLYCLHSHQQRGVRSEHGKPLVHVRD